MAGWASLIRLPGVDKLPRLTREGSMRAGTTFLALLVGTATGCVKVESSASDQLFEDVAVFQSEVYEGIGAAVAIVVDTSGSMDDLSVADNEPKYLVARKALEQMFKATDEFVKKRPDFPIKVTIWSFASSPYKVLPIQTYDADVVRQALARIPGPGGGTGIGEAMAEARPELYRSGTYRKYIVVVTDGRNTSGRDPEPVARQIYKKSEGVVETYFIAFDTDPHLFGFLKDVGGDVIPANNATELQAALKQIYEGKILAEAVDYGETETIPPSTGR